MPPPSGCQYKNVPAPFWFNDVSADAFRAMSMRPDDVILSSMVKAGTTWVHKILHSLLHVYDDEGNIIPGSNEEGSIGSSGQVYPDAIPLDDDDRKRRCSKDGGKAGNFVKKQFGDFTFQDLCDQPSPRLISTHLFGMELLPSELLGIPTKNRDRDDENGADDKEGKGRLVIVLRNLKDVMCSLHFFLGEAKDGWLGNEHGPGSFNRFIDENCPNAFGSCFDWAIEQDKAVKFLQEQASRVLKKERVLVVYYEALKADLPAQIGRINTFLELPSLTNAKRMAVAEACGFSAMKGGSAGRMTSVIMRKGSIGDWRNHLNKECWEKFDDVFARKLGNVDITGPLRHFQWWEIPGIPTEIREHWTLETDPRTWPAFERVCLEEGLLIPDKLIARSETVKEFLRPPSEYRGQIPSPKYAAEAGRYHLFVSGICPWASSVATARQLLGLQDVISMDIADGQSGAGWAFLNGTSVAPWKGRDGPFWLHEAYQLDDSLATSRITVPLLWDTKTNSVVSNDSWTIVKMMSTAFAGMGNPLPAAAALMATDTAGHPTLIPESQREFLYSQQGVLYNALLNGVYKAGLGLMKNHDVESEPVLVARKEVYEKLDEVEGLLSKQRFLLGDKLTAPDVRLAMTLFRWDASYQNAFVLTGGHGGILLGDGYPNLKAYLRDLYVVMEPTIDFVAIRQYYRIRQSVNKAFVRSQGKTYEEEKEKDLPPIPDLREIIASAKQPPGSRPP